MLSTLSASLLMARSTDVFATNQWKWTPVARGVSSTKREVYEKQKYLHTETHCTLVLFSATCRARSASPLATLPTTLVQKKVLFDKRDYTYITYLCQIESCSLTCCTSQYVGRAEREGGPLDREPGKEPPTSWEKNPNKKSFNYYIFLIKIYLTSPRISRPVLTLIVLPIAVPSFLFAEKDLGTPPGEGCGRTRRSFRNRTWICPSCTERGGTVNFDSYFKGKVNRG